MLRFLVLFGGGVGYLHPPSRTDTEEGLSKVSRTYTLMVYTLNGAMLKDTKKFPPRQNILGGGTG